MRRPAQHAAWSHPYTGIEALAVFYNDGSVPPAPAPIPTPADLAARVQGNPQAAPPAPPAHIPPGQRVSDDGRELLMDKHTGQPMTQGRFSVIMTRENAKGRNAAIRELCEAAGLPFDEDNFDPKAFGEMLKNAEETRKAKLTQEQQVAEELAKRERAAAEREARAEAREQAAAARDRETKIRGALARLGAYGDDQDDAYALLKDKLAADADDAAITEAATALKTRRADFFGATLAPQTLPPAPGGAPAGGPPARTAPNSNDALKEAARKRAEAMGLRRPEAA